jgi:hypothetical protein
MSELDATPTTTDPDLATRETDPASEPEAPETEAPEAETPGAFEAPEPPELPEVPEVPEWPDTSDAPEVPEAPEPTEMPEPPDSGRRFGDGLRGERDRRARLPPRASQTRDRPAHRRPIHADALPPPVFDTRSRSR